jgi:glutamine---fructose-6-phosphate transaminase (isomerizing)
VDPSAFLADLERKPEVLNALADHLTEVRPFAGLLDQADRILLLGMGSSAYAAGVAASRLRHRDIDAASELASSDLLPPAGPRLMVVAISASGASTETVEAVARYRGRAQVVALTNVEGGPLAAASDLVVPLLAGVENGGVACRSFQHTLALLLALEAEAVGNATDLPELLRRCAEASADLLDRRAEWLPEVARLLDGRDGVYVAAPARRFSSAQQSALMLREGPRRPGVACETGDWNHVDVYLTRSLGYRLLLLAGARADAELLEWTASRQSTVIAVGEDVAGAAYSVRYRHDEQDDVRLLTEVLVAELLAQRWWAA